MSYHPRVPDIGWDADAFEVFYRQHIEAVRRFVARRVSDPQVAADVTADIFVAAIESASSYRSDRGTPVAWLYGIARHVVAGETRRRMREGRAVRRFSGRRLLDGDAQARIEDRIDAERDARRLYRAMAEMSGKDRALLELVALDGLPVSEAAAVLGLKPAAARVRLHRARQRIQAKIPHADLQEAQS
jgi:RNA polymerase sigma factor (sigma-70 family)